MVTLRGVRMYEFLDRFVTIALPRVRDFRGISGRAFDGRGNYNIGVKEQIIFPEIEYDKVDALRGLNISITTTAKTDDEAQGAARRRSASRSRTEVDPWPKLSDQARSQAREAGRQVRRRSTRNSRPSSTTRALAMKSAACARLRAAEAAAQRQPDPSAQPLRAHRSSRGTFRKFGLAANQDPRIGLRAATSPVSIKASW